MKVGGLYIRGEGIAQPCDRLPFELKLCPVCGSGIHFNRFYQVIDWSKYAGKHDPCKDRFTCPICDPDHFKENWKYAIMWVGEKYYSTKTFVQEAEIQGISKRIPAIPHGFEPRKTWILLAHKKAVKELIPDPDGKKGEMLEIWKPGIFYAFVPTVIEKILTKTQAKDKKLIKKLQKQGIKIKVATKWDRKTKDVLEMVNY